MSNEFKALFPNQASPEQAQNYLWGLWNSAVFRPFRLDHGIVTCISKLLQQEKDDGGILNNATLSFDSFEMHACNPLPMHPIAIGSQQRNPKQQTDGSQLVVHLDLREGQTTPQKVAVDLLGQMSSSLHPSMPAAVFWGFLSCW